MSTSADAELGELREVEGVEGLAHLVHHEVGDVRDVVDGALPDGLQAPDQPLGRRRDLHAAHHARGVARAQGGVLDLDRRELLRLPADAPRRQVWESHRRARERRRLARDAEVREAVRAVRGQVELEHEVVARLLHRVHREPRHRQALRQLARRERHVGQLAEPVVTDVHKAVVSRQ
jgi:hypothetical protein